MFEVGPLPEAWLPGLRSHDGVIVPSNYCAELFAAAGCPPVAVVPPGADPRFSPEAPPLRLAARAVVFLFVGEYNHRKGIDIAVRAYARAFTPEDEVTLVVKTWSSRIPPPGIEKAIREQMRRVSASPPHVLFVHGMLPDSLLPSLYTAASALVMPSRAEAFGLPAAEAQACGLPVIAPRSTGLSETLHAESAYIVGISGMMPSRPDGLPWDFYEGRLMPEPDEDHIVDMMREIRQHPEVAKSKGRAASRMQHRRPWRQAGLELLELLERPRVSGAGE
jgi:glycosyltransferase involved in cell wall biosynthesis